MPTPKKTANATKTEAKVKRLREADPADAARELQRVTARASQYTEVHATERLAKHLRKRFRFCPEFGWMEWTGMQWSEVSEDVVIEASRQRHKAWYTEPLGQAILLKADSGVVPALKRLLSRNGVTAVVALSRGQLHIDGNKFDSHTDLLNTPSGVVDLRTGQVSEHDPELLLTKITAVGYRTGAKHKDWKAVLAAIRPDTRDYMQVRCGNAITGHQPDDDRVTFFKGGGENGKSTFIGGMTTPLGSYYRQVSDKVLLADSKSHTTELTDLHGLRVSVIEELPEGRHINVILLKKITSQEITARKMRMDTMTFDTTHSTFVTTNYATQVAETDWGTWRRLERIVFPYTYVKASKKLQARERAGDAGLRDRVRTDPAVQEAALAWMVEGARRWYVNGNRMPAQPESVKADTDEWRMDSDLVFRYFDEWLVADPDSWVSRGEFTDHFNAWLKSDRHQAWNHKTVMQRFGDHEVFKNHHIEATSIKPRTGLSRPPDFGGGGGGGDGERVRPNSTQRAWVGVRYREADE